MGIFDFLKPKDKQKDREIGAIFKLFDIMIGLGEKESKKEMEMLSGATFLVLDEYGVDVNNPDKYIQISNKMSKNQLIDMLVKIDSDKVMKIIFPKLIKLMTADGTVNPKRLDFLDMIGNTFVESGTIPKEVFDTFLEKVNKKKESSKKSTNSNDDINHDIVAIIHLFRKMSSYGISNKEGKTYFADNYTRLFMDAHNEKDSSQETIKKYTNLADNLSEDKLINIISKFNQTKSDDVFKLLLGLSVVGEHVTKDSVALLQFLSEHTKLSKGNLDMIKQATTML